MFDVKNINARRTLTDILCGLYIAGRDGYWYAGENALRHEMETVKRYEAEINSWLSDSKLKSETG